ncbi:MAG TPA: alpha/beta hydrolase [Burkholderiales bacterium]|nr:alpha/beta hydrolase [Burkholderiales bacterium]
MPRPQPGSTSRTPKPALHFSHANGFPARTYGAMLGALGERYRLSWIDAIGTDPGYPVSEGWPHLVEQLIDSIEEPPVYAVGHSLGGYLSFLAAARRPELFRAIVLLDAPIIGPFRGTLLGATKRLGVVDRVTPAGVTRDRRSHWRTVEEAKAHFRTRRLYRHLAEECLDDYVRHGLVRDAAGELRLRIDPLVEYQIYRTIPHGMMRHLRDLRVPAGFIGGEDSDVVRRVRLAGMRPKFVICRVPGGHLFPLERPREAAQAIVDILDALG